MPPKMWEAGLVAAAVALGPRAWGALHLVGGYYLLLQFTVSFGMRIPAMALYALFLIPRVAVFVVRMVAMASRATPRTIEAGQDATRALVSRPTSPTPEA